MCTEARFKCRNGRCVDRSFLCDGQDNCQDNSDEELCLTTAGKSLRQMSEEVIHVLKREFESFLLNSTIKKSGIQQRKS